MNSELSVHKTCIYLEVGNTHFQLFSTLDSQASLKLTFCDMVVYPCLYELGVSQSSSGKAAQK